jgi:hypothetical protein
MRLSWLKIAIAAAAVSLPLAAQNNQLFSPQMPPTAQAPRPTAVPAQAPPSSAQKPAQAQKTIATAPAAKSHKPATTKGRHGKKKKVVEVAKAPELPPPPPPPPPTPEQMPANPPQVSYLNGQLTIQSTNATLSSILSAVRQQTGAQIDLPPGTGSERVATRVGPGPARDVIASLLSGSTFDFLILGTPNSPGGVQRVILTPRSTGKTGAAGSLNMAGMVQRPAASEPDENNTEEEAETPEPPEQEPPQQPPMTAVPNPPQQPPPDQQGNTAPKVPTPDQLLQELQGMAPKQ